MSKWGWWDIQFTSWALAEFHWGIETSSLFMGMLAGIFAVLVPLGGWLGDHPKVNRIAVMSLSLVKHTSSLLLLVLLSTPFLTDCLCLLVNARGCLCLQGLLAVTYALMGPWQLSWPLETRRSVLVPYIVLEGILCPLLEPIFLPLMLDNAMEGLPDSKGVRTDYLLLAPCSLLLLLLKHSD